MARSRSTVPALKPLGQNIRAVRKHMGLCQKEFAELISVSQSVVCQWEMAHTAPSAVHIMTICYKCGVSADDLLGVPRKWVKIK